MSHDAHSKGPWIAAKDVQPEDIQGPFEVRMRVDPPPGLGFWDHPLWVYGRSEGQDAGEAAQLMLTHHAQRKDAQHPREGWPLKILYPILIDFSKNAAEEHLVIKIDLRNVEIRTRDATQATKIKAERRKYPELAPHASSWKNDEN